MKIRESTFKQNLFTMVFILTISFIVLALSFSSLTYRLVNNEKHDNMAENARQVAAMVSAYGDEGRIGGLSVLMQANIVSGLTGYHITICEPSGNVVVFSGDKSGQDYLGKQVSAGFLTDIDNYGQYEGVTDLDGLFNDSQYVIGLPVNSYRDNSLMGYLFISGTVRTFDEIWRQSAWVFLISAVAVLAVAYVMILVTTRRQVEPINQMAVAAHKFAKGDFSVRVETDDRQDEIGDLARAFNKMADSMEKSENRRREFIANVSHELKTPMTTIAGFADGILDGTIPKSKQNEYLGIISSETRRLSRLVRSMLDMSQLQSDQEIVKKPFDLSETVCQAILSLEKKITDKGLDVDAILPEEPVTALGNSDSIMQVVYNLIDNAAKFAPTGTIIRIELWKQGEKAFVSVQNHGETISKEELPLIFERFHKTDKSRSMDRDGVGLGLYIVKTIMDSHNGDIFVTSEDGVTKFVISLELAE